MKSFDVTAVYKARFKKLLKYYHNLLEDFKANDIHHFRLEIKKLKAFLCLINITYRDQHHKIPKDLKLFYKLTGNVRNFQLHHKRIVDLCKDLLLEIPSVYLQYLDDEEKVCRKQLRQMAKSISIRDFENRVLHEEPRKISGEDQRDFIQRELARINELLTLSFYTDEALHEARKILKELMYNFKYFDAAEIATSFQGIPSLRSMTAITATLGDYHDLCISLSLLNGTNVKGITDVDETKILNELLIQLQLRKDVMKIEIIELMKQLKQGVVDPQIPLPQ